MHFAPEEAMKTSCALCSLQCGQHKMPPPAASEKSAQRDANTARALAVVRFGHRPPACCHKPTDRTDYNTLHRS